MNTSVVSFYRFLDLPDPQQLCTDLQALCRDKGLLGTILVADEGFNGTLAGAADAIREVFDWLRECLNIDEPLDSRWTVAGSAPFKRMRVKVKKEIVTLGRPDLLPHEHTGEHVDPKRWNVLLADPDVVVIDTRNRYEIEVGTFPGSLDPGNDSFREFPEFAQSLADEGTDKKLAMFCTGRYSLRKSDRVDAGTRIR